MQMKTRSPRVLASAKGHVTAVAALELQPGMGMPSNAAVSDLGGPTCTPSDVGSVG